MDRKENDMADYYIRLKDLAVGYQGTALIRDINIAIEVAVSM